VIAIALAAGILDAQSSLRNILIAEPLPNGAHQPSEPSIAVSLKDPNVIVAGVILDRALYTSDGGGTWGETTLKSPYGVFGDPTLISDAQGNFYFFHLSSGKTADEWIDRIVCQKSTDGGKTWTDGVGIGHNPPADQDKQWAAAHPTKPNLCVTWTQFDKYGAKEPKFQSNIMFSQSTDAGATWSPAVKINDISGDCLDGDDTTEGAVPAIGADGKFYVAWSAQGIIFFDRSKDGKAWLPNDRPIARQYGGWDMEIPGLNRTNGMPVLMIDNSPGPHKGSLYVVWADQRNGTADTDIFLMRSTNGGDTWSAPLRVNQDGPGKQQFLPWMAVDPTTGYVYIVYYDRRAYTDNQTDVYVAYSTDGGVSFSERKISEKPFTPVPTTFFGDYNNISANKGIITPAWTRMDNSKTTVWTAAIRHTDLAKPQ